MIGSGPTALDHTTLADCRAVLERFGVHRALGCDDVDELRLSRIVFFDSLTSSLSPFSFMRQYQFAETPKDPSLFERVENIVLVDSQLALDAMSREAEVCVCLCAIADCVRQPTIQ